MENFFYNDNFYLNLDDFIDDRNENFIDELDESSSFKIQLSTLEPMFQLHLGHLANILFDINEERYSEEGNEVFQIEKALKESIDFVKLNSMIPKFYYPNNKFEYITKETLKEYIK